MFDKLEDLVRRLEELNIELTILMLSVIRINTASL